ncbi:MAG: hypothetical protein FJ128_09490 [Deltaproteobacteria bacterium]|nr:hypothetical protein [Deltaproteobacteria bacterium]
MARARPQPLPPFMEHLRSLLESAEVGRLIHDITSCRFTWKEGEPADPQPLGGIELFPCFTFYFQRKLLEIRGSIVSNLLSPSGEGLAHLIHLDLGGRRVSLSLTTSQAAFLLSPFHLRFLSMLFGRVILHFLALTPEGKRGLAAFTPYSLEEQVVAGYLQSLEATPCATIKLDAQDTPYIGSMLYRQADLKRCEIPGSPREESIIMAWRLFKRLLYYPIEGERLYTGFALMSPLRPLDYYRQHWPHLLLYREDNHVSLEEGLPALKQFLLNADGRFTFLALYGGRIVGLLQLHQVLPRQLISQRSWRSVMFLATISGRGRVSFWLPLKGRKSPRIPLSVLEYRHGHLHIPLFQDIFWRELEQQLRDICARCPHSGAFANLQRLLTLVRRGGHGAIFIIGATEAQLAGAELPLENQVFLTTPTPLEERWLRHLLGLSKSDGALIFNNRLEAVQFRARLKAAGPPLPVERDDLGSGMRHQVTREFTAHVPGVLGLTISQDGDISLYRHGTLVSRLY